MTFLEYYMEENNPAAKNMAIAKKYFHRYVNNDPRQQKLPSDVKAELDAQKMDRKKAAAAIAFGHYAAKVAGVDPNIRNRKR